MEKLDRPEKYARSSYMEANRDLQSPLMRIANHVLIYISFFGFL